MNVSLRPTEEITQERFAVLARIGEAEQSILDANETLVNCRARLVELNQQFVARNAYDAGVASVRKSDTLPAPPPEAP